MKPTIQVCALDSSNFILNYSNFDPSDAIAIYDCIARQLNNEVVNKIEIKKFGEAK